ncbi:hypothetical protein [Falsigemmobacter faecalis]|uniref:Flagellar protein FlgN n=1 Tax=Falsigemmobacter faecalis TaxID=2488730 RepID=A0A3P3DNM7_9RHOB|nr:hypothetical protein [Falsigemmobacter faecalis]RRH75775.1 hypothetical protein EG244_07560 [Falsigemmobacter faecalis]
MKLAPAAAISRIAARFQERRSRAALGERPPLTGDDEDNISRFAGIVADLTAVLERENEALLAGDVTLVAELFGQKQVLLTQLETRQPVVEPFLRESAAVTEALRSRIQVLATQINRNAALLEAMSDAARAIRLEVSRVRDRHSLNGMYDKSGHTRGQGPAGPPREIDTNL